MNINQLNSQSLRMAINLLEEKESLQAKIAEIEQQLAQLFEEGAAAAPLKIKRVKVASGNRRGQVKDAFIAMLQQAGRKGVTLKEVCQELGKNQSSINSWLHSTGKKIPQIKRIGRGQYAWVG